MRLLSRFLADESAVAALEFGIIAAGIAVTLIAAFQVLGSKLNGTFAAISDSLGSGQSGSELGHRSTQP
jgi:pilus assembly protein Flp/PilA